MTNPEDRNNKDKEFRKKVDRIYLNLIKLESEVVRIIKR